MNTQGIAFIGDSIERNINDRSRAHVQFSARHIEGASVAGIAQGNVSIGLVACSRRRNKKTQATAPLLRKPKEKLVLLWLCPTHACHAFRYFPLHCRALHPGCHSLTIGVDMYGQCALFWEESPCQDRLSGTGRNRHLVRFGINGAVCSVPLKGDHRRR